MVGETRTKKEVSHDDSVSETSGNDMFEEAVDRLRSYSFVSVGEDGRTFENAWTSTSSHAKVA